MSGYDIKWARDDARTLRGRTEEQADRLRRQSAQSAAVCIDCFRPLAPTDSVTMTAYNFGSKRNPNWQYAPSCLICTLTDMEPRFWSDPDHPDYGTETCIRRRCLNCGRPLRLYSRRQLPLTMQTCCGDCQRAMKNKRNKLRRRVKHEPITCIQCGRSFLPKRSDALTCSNACRQQHHRLR